MCHYNHSLFNIIINSFFCISIHLFVILFFIRRNFYIKYNKFLFFFLFIPMLIFYSDNSREYNLLYPEIMLFHFFWSTNFKVTMAVRNNQILKGSSSEQRYVRLSSVWLPFSRFLFITLTRTLLISLLLFTFNLSHMSLSIYDSSFERTLIF